jgi:hypothetical protein
MGKITAPDSFGEMSVLLQEAMVNKLNSKRNLILLFYRLVLSLLLLIVN